jgi:hypothetical protein
MNREQVAMAAEELRRRANEAGHDIERQRKRIEDQHRRIEIAGEMISVARAGIAALEQRRDGFLAGHSELLARLNFMSACAGDDAGHPAEPVTEALHGEATAAAIEEASARRCPGDGQRCWTAAGANPGWRCGSARRCGKYVDGYDIGAERSQRA